ncbi:MAG: plastocyanin/azurin family copper-binding protein [Ilumatobacteraceae bacterium]|jgi:plastocyanin
MKRLPVLRPLVGLLLAAGIAAGCSSSSATPDTVPAGTNLEVRAVSGLRFDKTAYEVAAGESLVAYVNDDTIRHTLVVVKDGTTVSGFELQVNKKGDIDSGSVTLDPGTYELFCTVPGHQSMKAALTVS